MNAIAPDQKTRRSVEAVSASIALEPAGPAGDLGGAAVRGGAGGVCPAAGRDLRAGECWHEIKDLC